MNQWYCDLMADVPEPRRCSPSMQALVAMHSLMSP